MENNRVTPRIRPRPYDLRRKVLLKNFLREQMTYIPPSRSLTETSLEVNDDLNFNENLSNSVGNEIILTEAQDSVVLSTSVPDPVPSTSTCNEKENSSILSSNQSLVKSVVSEVEKIPSTKFSRLSNLLTMKSKRKKCISKAKHDTKAVKSIRKPFFKLNKDAESSTEEKPNRFFTMFKLRREKKRIKIVSPKKRKPFQSQSSLSPKEPQITTTSNQSVQTDLSWSREEYDHMERWKREQIESLREENRMLSESLSNMISDGGSQFKSRKRSFFTDSYVDNANNSTMFSSPERHSIDHDYADQSLQIDSSRTRVLRSKSMQEKCIKRNLATSRLRARSMNRGSNKSERFYDTRYFSTNESYSTRQRCFRAGSASGYNSYSAKVKPAAVPNSNYGSSNVHGSLVLKTWPSNSGKALVRRSSMPERTCTWNKKPFHPLRSNSVRESNRSSHRSRQTAFRSVQPDYRRKPSISNEYNHLPFQDLPPEAFY